MCACRAWLSGTRFTTALACGRWATKQVGRIYIRACVCVCVCEKESVCVYVCVCGYVCVHVVYGGAGQELLLQWHVLAGQRSGWVRYIFVCVIMFVFVCVHVCVCMCMCIRVCACRAWWSRS